MLDGVDAAFEVGRLTVILGPNGAGKSTLLKVASGEWRPSQGSIELDGKSLQSYTAMELARRRAVVPQATQLSFPFTALQVVLLGKSVPGFGPPSDATPALLALHDVGLRGYENRVYTRMSGGERQRVHLARALCQLRSCPVPPGCSQALLLNEPTASLDPAHQVLTLSLLQRLARQGTAVAIVMHDLNLAAAWAEHVILMSNGRIVATGPPGTVLSDDLLGLAYACTMRVGQIPIDGKVFVLPHNTIIEPHARRSGPAG